MSELEIDDRAYFAHRARQEIMKAANCENDEVARAHLKFANEYQKRGAEIARATGETPLSL